MTLPVWETDFYSNEENLFAGRYRLGPMVGRGGAATVYQALDERLGRQVAIKVFRSDAVSDLMRRFEVEARLLARLRHPGLVKIFDFGHTPQGPYLVLELLPGPSLAALLRGGSRSTAETLRIGLDLARTLEYVHGEGVVHRDVKPANILFDEDGSPRLADFGISCAVDTAASTRTGSVMGTAAYLAPEQVRGHRAGPQADIFALGLVLIECLTGEREYVGTPVEAAIARLRRPPAIPAGLPWALTQLLDLVTRIDPDERITAAHCAGLLAESLRHPVPPEAATELLSTPPVPPYAATAEPPPTAPRRRTRRRGPVAAASALLIGGGVVGGIVATSGAAPQPPPAHQSSARVTAAPTGGRSAPATVRGAAGRSLSAAPSSEADPSPTAPAVGGSSHGKAKNPKAKVKDPGHGTHKND